MTSSESAAAGTPTRTSGGTAASSGPAYVVPPNLVTSDEARRVIAGPEAPTRGGVPVVLPPAPRRPERPPHVPEHVLLAQAVWWAAGERPEIIVRFAPPQGGDAMAIVEPRGSAYGIPYAVWQGFVDQVVPMTDVEAAALGARR